MENEQLGSFEHIRAQDFTNVSLLVEYIGEMRRNGFSYDEIQSALYRAGYSVDNTTIQLACNR